MGGEYTLSEEEIEKALTGLEERKVEFITEQSVNPSTEEVDELLRRSGIKPVGEKDIPSEAEVEDLQGPERQN